jgi:hypothetical protein
LNDVHVVGAGLDVHEHGDRPDVHDRLDGGEECERCRDDLVTFADPERVHDQEQRVGAVRARDRVLRTAVGGDGFLERLDLRPADEPGAAHDVAPYGVELVLEPEVLRLQIE